VGLVVAGRIIGARPSAQDPPETTGAGTEELGDGAGDWAGAERPLDPELVLEGPLLEDDDEAWLDVAVAELVELWPWKDLAAANEMTPASATAPAISQRLTREISASPALRALTDRGPMVPDGRRQPLENAKRAVRKR
jgi:hypothetical protein